MASVEPSFTPEIEVLIQEEDESDLILNREYNNSNPENETGQTFQKDFIKDTVMQQIFGYNKDTTQSHILTQLKQDYKCDISYSAKNGKYGFFIRPNETNYMIHATHSIKDGKPRIFFNLTLKNKIGERINTEYICCYSIEGEQIVHQYNMQGKPATIKRSTININTLETYYNPYLEFNNLLREMGRMALKITMEDTTESINEKIETLRKLIKSTDTDKLNRISNSINGKNKSPPRSQMDAEISKNYNLAKIYLSKSVGTKGPEDINSTVTISNSNETNNDFTEMLAFRYAKYIPGFTFTKSSKNGKEFTDPFKFKLETPFTATDIYLHRFDRTFGFEYAMDRYDINTPEQFIRLADMVELSKSLMMSFINISHNLKKMTVNSEQNIQIDIYNIYQGLIWHNNRIRQILGPKYFTIRRSSNGINITHISRPSEPTIFTPFTPMSASEIPFISVLPPINPNIQIDKDKKPVNFKFRPVVESPEDIRTIELGGIEGFLLSGARFGDAEMDRLYNIYFEDDRQKVDTKPTETEIVNLDPSKFSSLLHFPQLGSTPIPPSVRQTIERSIAEAIIRPESEVASIPHTTISVEPPVAPRYAAAAALPSSTATVAAAPKAAAAAAAAAVAVAPKAASTALAFAPKAATEATSATSLSFTASDISNKIIDIKKFKRENMKKIPGETRRDRGIRLKQIRPIIYELKQLREKQIRELRNAGIPVPKSVAELKQDLRKANIQVPLSRPQKAYKELVLQIENKQTELTAKAEELRKYREENKSITQQHIADLMEQQLELKRQVYIKIPSDFIKDNNLVKDGVGTLNLTQQQKLEKEMKPILDQIAAIQSQIDKLNQELEQSDEFKAQQRLKIEAQEETDAAIRAQREADRVEKDRQRMIAADTKAATLALEKYNTIKQQADALKGIINRNTTLAEYPKYKKHILDVIEKTVESFEAYKDAVEHLAIQRAKIGEAKFTDEEMKPFVDAFNTSLAASKANKLLFDAIEKLFTLSKSASKEDIEAYNETISRNAREYNNKLKEAEAARKAAEEAAERKAAAERLKAAQIRGAKIAAANKELTPEQIIAKTGMEYKAYVDWNTNNKLISDEIEKLKRDIASLERDKAALIKTTEEIKFQRRPPKEKKTTLENITIFTARIEGLEAALKLKQESYKIFLVENKKLIETNSNFPEDFRKHLLELMGETQTDVKRKYMIYKYKYLKLKELLNN